MAKKREINLDGNMYGKRGPSEKYASIKEIINHVGKIEQANIKREEYQKRKESETNFLKKSTLRNRNDLNKRLLSEIKEKIKLFDALSSFKAKSSKGDD
mmetsp:Transcript_22616/g.25982  ORF Transcript_22616/g.25982 Transcript_22616/m.25982 type:complete len:99 (+) Transcript_22616:1227-1523(+)|eukprot:CAMPEP_0168337748 /NCGR_PEP_ID=MMETSP0213-20121227/12387_1 /TAXON_ID=151035 /ORGANISM="Euplotes harpa, Strain FSP1.4" /LENGTH=98 /DNA_ID=CAMNT_0008343321 /DNA_START=1219 /DNA_END=1512 /DNA_ORIENTATION=-